MENLKKLTIYEYQPKSMLVNSETKVDRAKYPAIDGHNHLRCIVDADSVFLDEYVEKMDSCNVQAIVDLDGGWGDTLDKHLEVLKKPRPDRFIIFASINFSKITEPDFGEKAAEELEVCIKKGAQGLKIFKSLGLGVKDEKGNYIPVDSPLLDPVWSKCGELKIPVVIHVSDPAAFFTPLDKYNERLEELIDRPEWMFNKPEYFSKEDLLLQRNRVISKHPGTNFIGAHVANLPEDLNKVSAWLDMYPNLYVDLSARLSELGRQPYSARRFIIKYADRIIFGTDGNAMGQSIEEMYRTHWRFLESDDEYFDISKSHKLQGRWNVYGLFLPDDVLEKIYRNNILKLISL